MRIEPLWVPLDMVTTPLITTNEIRCSFVKTNDVVVFFRKYAELSSQVRALDSFTSFFIPSECSVVLEYATR